ncbi:hypothetical protein S101446_02042 [Komagataeibacter europaeus]|nr:hypothetical protein S101446_02042 [Komagataeibacter europaeus]
MDCDSPFPLMEMVARLKNEQSVGIGRSMLSRWLRQHRWTFKKKTEHVLEQEREDILQRRQAWFDSQPDLDPHRLVFIDETCLSTKMTRLRGRALRGERCRVGVPHGHWKTTPFTAGLRLTGMTAPFVHDGAMNSEIFPVLSPGDIVVLDNPPAHKVPGCERSSYEWGHR